MNYMNADNDVLYGIRTVASLLQDGHLLISDRCTGLIKEIPGYAWSPKATEKGLDAPIKANDHSCDSLRYSIATSETLWRPIHQHTDRRMTECHCPQSAVTWPPEDQRPIFQRLNEWQAWWSGDPDALRKAYAGTSVRPSLAARGGVAGAVKRFFWGEPGN